MRTEDVTNFWIPAMEALFKEGDHMWCSSLYAIKLDDLLGVRVYNEFWNSKLHFEGRAPLSDDLKQVCRMLAGPHAKAVLKAYRIVKGLEP